MLTDDEIKAAYEQATGYLMHPQDVTWVMKVARAFEAAVIIKGLPLDYPKRGELWDSLHDSRTCRVMCDPVEGYVMARYKGAAPWLLHVSDWHKKFRRKG